ncbi:helix-turn-helix domain-containing protein [Pseudomonas sp. F1_0610]|uniref:helix-turn-helix domain-containing protein n=1 Tax=Pseudomonas sp. F1_0610 TaxID=3114284 RepID=UPI0039C35BCB
MSMIWMVKAMQAKVGNPLRKLVLIKLADNANEKGECFPSYKHISDQCEISHSTVRKHIKDLELMGFLTIENRRGVLGNSSNIYRLTIDNKPNNPMPSESTPMPCDGTPLCRHTAP